MNTTKQFYDELAAKIEQQIQQLQSLDVGQQQIQQVWSTGASN